MNSKATLLSCVVLLSLLTLSSGCVFVTYSKHSVQFTVRDSENDKPIPQVPVRILYHCGPVLNAPENVEGVTDSDGQVELVVADPKGCSITARVGGQTFDKFRDFNLNREMIRKGGVPNPLSGYFGVTLEMKPK